MGAVFDGIMKVAQLGAGGLASYAGYAQGQQNLKMQQDNLAWQKYVQQESWNREDNAVARRAADLEKAGLSKTLAAGSAADSGTVVQTSAPQDKTLESVLNGISVMNSLANVNKTNQEAANLEMNNKYTAKKIQSLQYEDALTQAKTLLTNGQTEMLGYSMDYTAALTAKAKQETAHDLLKMGYTQAQIDYTYKLGDKVGWDISLAQQQYKMNENELSLFETQKAALEASLTQQLLKNEEQRMENVYMNTFGQKMATSSGSGLSGLISDAKGLASRFSDNYGLFGSGSGKNWRGY